ncbi:hypothetical protein pdul_cds_920 [Pandoravirus dulcis]|uniref:Uncharacterized protein n=1 Tax=Pandoravirus dulcis TaxID=1349409 RepID=S4VZ70_9VIRU|nr:hypothetical protein pdul_cds_920 [Pandoravirus dulcis]AGO83159.1 hypothetical protein pdul_cds_920 [Pandoravirus dulcis]
MNIGDVIIPLRDATSGDPRGAVTLACLDADDGLRYFFGPLLVRASGAKRSHSLYRKIRLMTTRRIATDAEMAFVRRRRADLWEAVMRERHTQVEQEANKDTRQRRQRQRRRAAERAATACQAEPQDAFATPPRPSVPTRRARTAPRRIVFQYRGGGEERDAKHVGDDDNDRLRQHSNGYGIDDEHADDDNNEDDDDDYDADGAGDLVPSLRPAPTHLTGATATVTADTIYLVEVTSRLVEFLGGEIVVTDDHPAPVAGRQGVKRAWQDILPAVAAWAAARDAAFAARADANDPGVPPYQRRRHRRKQDRPMRALSPLF